MNLMTEMQLFGIKIPSVISPKVFCKLFEDNAGGIHLAKVLKMRPRTRHTNQKYHHFREWVKTSDNGKGSIEIFPIDTLEQPADLLTKRSIWLLPDAPPVNHGVVTTCTHPHLLLPEEV